MGGYGMTENGIAFNYIHSDNSKETIILAHGLGLDMETWNPLLDYLKDFNVLMFDFRGHGKSCRLQKVHPRRFFSKFPWRGFFYVFFWGINDK